MTIPRMLFAAMLASAAFATAAVAATPIDGRWNCTEKMNRNGLKGTITSVADFRPDGTLSTVLVMQAYKLIVPIHVEARYSARWQLVDGRLIEQAESATVTAFTIAGVDSLQSEHAAEFKNELMTPGAAPQVHVVSENQFELRQPSRVTVCTR